MGSTVFPLCTKASAAHPQSGGLFEDTVRDPGVAGPGAASILWPALGDLQHGQEGFLRNVDLADAFHATLASFCFSSSLRLREMSPP